MDGQSEGCAQWRALVSQVPSQGASPTQCVALARIMVSAIQLPSPNLSVRPSLQHPVSYCVFPSRPSPRHLLPELLEWIPDLSLLFPGAFSRVGMG